MKYTRMPVDTFKKLQLNAGIIARKFNPETGEVLEEDLVGATSGGTNFNATPEYSDFGEDIDNCPTNVKELKKLVSWTATMSGTFLTVDTKAGKMLVGAVNKTASTGGKIVPSNDVSLDAFEEIWWIGDYSDVNDATEDSGKAGFIAVHLLNSLSTGGFQIQSGNKEKGQFSFEFTGHYSMDAQDTPPFEIYIVEGEAAA